MFCKFSSPAKFPDIVCCAICFKAFGGTSPIPTKDIALVNVENFCSLITTSALVESSIISFDSKILYLPSFIHFMEKQQFYQLLKPLKKIVQLCWVV